MSEIRERVVSAIARAQAELSSALGELERVPAIDPGSAAFAAHALNNYLTVISGTTELLEVELNNAPNPQVQTWIEGIRHATDLMLRTVAQLMNSASSSAFPLRTETVDLGLLVQRVCNYYQRLAARKSMRVIFDSAGDGPMVRADRVALAAALDNLMSNAMKYSEPGRPIKVDIAVDASGAACRVHDEGPGLSVDDQARLFRRGVRLTPKPTAGEPSMGYGLAVAKELVERMGGRISCESTLGHGSTFAIWMPVAASEN